MLQTTKYYYLSNTNNMFKQVFQMIIKKRLNYWFNF